MSYLRYLCLFAYSGVQQMPGVFALFFPSSCVPCIANFSGLSVFDCPSVFPNVYLELSNLCSSSIGFELTPLINCVTNLLSLLPSPQTIQTHPQYNKISLQ